ncbi:MAG: hypothetical protein Q8K98_01440, partial [Bacteroidota bacterium]|nr:hypothetical protein [Bacteroidota bacterium]
MKIKILTICFSILFFGITNVYCQIFATPFSDEDQIKILLKDIINSVNNDRPIKVENYFINQSKKSGLQLDTNIIRQYIRSPIELKIYSINIEEETAKASCYLISPYIIDPIKDNLLLQKINGQWTIISSEYLYSLCKIFQEKRNTPQSISNDNQDLYKSNSVNIRYSNKLLIPKKVPGTNKKKLTESDIISYIGKSLFAHPIDIEYASYEENNGNKTFVGFCLDRNWNRIIIQKIITDNNNNILNSQLISYGDNVNEYKFYGPQGLSYAECGEIYIADTDNDKIVKLLFDRHTLTLTLSQTKEIEGIYFPTDVVYDNNNTPQLEDDFIWITDPNAAKIVRLDRQFNILQTITSYIDDYGNNSQLDMPKKIMVNNIHASYQKRLAYINSNTFVELIPGNSPPFFNSVFYWSIKKFQTPSNLSSIGLEWPEGWLLLDEGRNCLHKINKWGDYIASFKSNLTTGSLFTFPKFISSSGVNIHASDTIKYLDIGAIDVWGLSTGFQNFLPGADVLDFKVKEYPASFVIEYTPTNWIKDSLKVLKKSDRTVVKEWPLWNTPPEKETESIMKSEIWYGNYIVRLTYRPLGDSEYGDYMQGWTAIEIPLTYLLPTTISNGQIYWGQTSTITANTFGQNSLTYSWTTEPNPVPAGTNFFVDNLYPYKAYLKNIRYSPYLLKVPMFGICIILTVSNSLGTHSITDFIGLIPGSSGGGGGCPFVYTWNGSEYIEDNNILPQSVYAPPDEGLVTDYYQLFTEPVETDRTYKLRVGEFEQEISTLDQFKLLIVDHIPEAMVSANDIGE